MSNNFNRRSFLGTLGVAVPATAAAPSLFAAQKNNTPSPRRGSKAKEMACDVVIIGGGTGGCAAALAAARNGMRVIMTEETDWIGGQLTSQAVPPDENAWIETHGGTRSYGEFRTRVRDYYKRNYPLTDAARAKPNLNPGNGAVSRLCHEPRVAVAVLEEMLAPYVGGQKVQILLRHKAVSAQVDGDRVQAVQVKNLETGNDLVLRAPFFIDATEQGDLLPMTKTEYVVGAESQKETGEPHAPEKADPENLQAFTVCYAMDYLPGEDHTIEKPREYGFWRDFVPKMDPPWPGKLLSFVYSSPATLKPRDYGFDADKATGFFLYRRIIDKTNFRPGTYAGDMTIVNWPQNDYLLGNLLDVPDAVAEKHLARAKQLSLSLLYWLQTEAPRPDGGSGWKGLRLRPDIVGTEDGMAKYPYIRESRRIRSEFTVTELHVGTDARAKITGVEKKEVLAELFPDSVGIGAYRIDLHPSTKGNNYIDFASLPFQIPLGALIPRRMENLVPACKNLGVTHLTNGCYRLHPVEWNIGEAAGALTAFCTQKKKLPRQVRASHVAEFQKLLTDDGVRLSWPK